MSETPTHTPTTKKKEELKELKEEELKEEEEQQQEESDSTGWGFSLPSISLPTSADFHFASLSDSISNVVKELETKADEAYSQMKGMTDEAVKNTVMEAERMNHLSRDDDFNLQEESLSMNEEEL
ncbi:hypothetical protein N9D57_03545, partial [bacterium]|nr:hypothetical protein [bacterium]